MAGISLHKASIATLSLLLAAVASSSSSSSFAEGIRAAALAAGDAAHIGQDAVGLPAPAGASDFGRDEAVVDAPANVTVHDSSSPKNFQVGLRLKPTSWNARGGIVLRRLTPQDYYVVAVDALHERVAFARVSEGKSAEIAGVESDIGANAWHTLDVRAQDNRFTVLLDGKWLFTAYDDALSSPGGVGLWTSQDGAVEFDGLSMKPLGPQ